MDSTTPSPDKTQGFAILEYLNSLKTAENTENIEVACQCIATALKIDITSADEFSQSSYFPISCSDLLEAGVTATGAMTYSTALELANKDPKFQIFADTCAKKGYFNGVEIGSLEYLQRNAKLIKKFREKTAAAAPSGAVGKLDAEAAAEEKKLAGNEAIKKKDYELAVQLYSEALQFSVNGPNAHIYYANRSAAYCHLQDYKNAVADCEASLRKSPTYTKAYSRLGLAQFFLQNYAASAAAYEKAFELEPSNKSHKDSMLQARRKLEEQEALSTTTASAAGAPGGMPDMAAMMSAMGGGAGGGGGGGFMQMAQQMMQNPAMMAQAQSMMQNPAMMAQAQSMMQNPDAMRQAMAAMGGGGEGGGMPDAAQMAQMAQMFGGAGSGGGGGGAGGIPDFSGFQNN